MDFSNEIFYIQNQKQFHKIALKLFRYQYENNLIYQQFCDFLKTNINAVKTIEKIPFLPISFFKLHEVMDKNKTPEITFTSSGTSGQITSKHLVSDLKIYENSFNLGFQNFYGNIEDYVVLALLPSYLERSGSSLVYMCDQLIKKSNQPESGFYLNNYSELIETIEKLELECKKTLLIGVTYALLDLVEMKKMQLKSTLIMETGGMKGKRKEMIREELHEILKVGFGVNIIHSEYGMTELLSQAYSFGNGIFECPNWMQILIRDPEDALTYLPNNKTGGINVVDLANINSCAFIATQDLGKKINNYQFEVLGRFDHADIRGCNLMSL